MASSVLSPGGDKLDAEEQLAFPLSGDGIITLVRGGEPVTPPWGMVYSCAPEIWHDENEVRFVTKGPAVSIVAAEYVSHEIARHVGVAVPDSNLALHPIERRIVFASRLLETALRDASIVTGSPSPAQRQQLTMIVLLDVWLANKDRNIGNLLLRSSDANDRAPELVAIDFEKSVAVADENPVLSCDSVNPSELWPSGDLGKQLRGLPKPGRLIDRISEVQDDFIKGTVARARERIGPEFSWSEGSGVALCRRRDRIKRLVAEVWR